MLDFDEARDFVREMVFGKSIKDSEGNPVEFTEDGFKSIFKILDVDESGSISKDEMLVYLKTVC